MINWTIQSVETLLTDVLVSGEALLMATFTNPVFSTPIQTLYFYIPVSGQLRLRTPFLCPEGVCLWELPFIIRWTAKLIQCIIKSPLWIKVINRGRRHNISYGISLKSTCKSCSTGDYFPIFLKYFLFWFWVKILMRY